MWTIPFLDQGFVAASTFIPYEGYLILYALRAYKGQPSVVDLASGKRVFTMQPNFPGECNADPMVLAFDQDHLYLATLDCIHSFQISQ